MCLKYNSYMEIDTQNASLSISTTGRGFWEWGEVFASTFCLTP